MSFLRTAAFARSLTSCSRRYSTEAAPKKASNLPLYLGGAGVLGLGAYVYFGFGSTQPKVEEKVPLKSPLDPANFVNFKLKKIEPYNHNTSRFIFELPEGQASLIPVTSSLYVASDPSKMDDGKGGPVLRPYTPVSPPDHVGELILLVKKYETGKVSKYIFSLQPGDSLAIKGPIPKWPYKANEFEHIGMIAGGSGITPLYQMLTYALRDNNNKTKFTLIYGNVEEKDILLREEFDEMKKKHPDTFDVIYVLDKPGEKWKGKTGYIGKDLITQYIPPPTAGNKVKVFVCGPPGQVTSIAGPKPGREQGEYGGVLKEMGYTVEQVYKF